MSSFDIGYDIYADSIDSDNFSIDYDSSSSDYSSVDYNHDHEPMVCILPKEEKYDEGESSSSDNNNDDDFKSTFSDIKPNRVSLYKLANSLRGESSLGDINNDDDFKSAFPDIIPNRVSLYKLANSLFDDQHAIFNRTIIPENRWIFENKLENFKLNLEDIDRFYYTNNYKPNKKCHYIKLCVRIKPVIGKEKLYVIFSEYRSYHRLCDLYIDNFQIKFGWILVTSNPHFFIEHAIDAYDESQNKNIIRQFLYNDEKIKEEYHRQFFDNNNVKNNDNNDYLITLYLNNIQKFIKQNVQKYPEILRLSMNKIVPAKDFGFYTFYVYDDQDDRYDRHKSRIFNKFDNLFITEVKLLYITKEYFNDYGWMDYEYKNDNNTAENKVCFHPNFKTVNFIDPHKVYYSMKNHLNDQYCKYGRTTIPLYEWIYENNLEFFKLNFQDIDRLYFFDNKKKLLCVRIEYKNKGDFFYVIFSEKLCIIYITSNPFLFIQHVRRLVKKISIISLINQLLNEDEKEQSSSIKALNEFCYKTIYKNNKQLQSHISNLPPVIKRNINEFNACKKLVQYKFYFRRESFQSRIFNIFTNRFLIDDMK